MKKQSKLKNNRFEDRIQKLICENAIRINYLDIELPSKVGYSTTVNSITWYCAHEPYGIDLQ